MHKEVFYTKKDIKDCRIAIFSDLHYYPSYPPKILNKIIKQIKESKVNYIAILGDILDSSNCTELSKLKDFLTTISSIAPTMVILGNHEKKAGYRHNWHNEENEELINILKSTKNLYFLNDSNYQDNNINFYGFNLSYEYYNQGEPYELFIEEVENLKTNLEDKNYNITLIHSPINIYKYLEEHQEYNLNKTNLILSGHMHNGCLPFWFSNIINKVFHTSRSIISPSGKLFPKYSQGRIYSRDGYIYQGISKLSKSQKFFHFFERFYSKQISIIEIKKTS